MEHYVGLDVSLKLTAICIVDRTGKIVREGAVASNPEAIAAFVKSHAPQVARIGLEAGATSTWLWTELNKMGLPVICIDARHAKAALKMQINKSDRKDAVGIARIMQCGWYKEVRVKDLDSHAIKALLVSRALLVKIKRDIENQIRGLLKNLGLVIGRAKMNVFAVRAAELIEDRPELAAAVEPLLKAREAIEQQIADFDRKVMRLARNDAQVRRFMTTPGVGAITALCFLATIDDPTRFKRSRSVGAYVGSDDPTIRIRRDRLDGPHLEMRRCDAAKLPLRSSQRAAHPRRQVVGAQSLGHPACEAKWAPQSKGCRGSKACRHPAPNVGRQHRVQLVIEGGRRSKRITTSLSSRVPAGDDVPAGTVAVVRSLLVLRCSIEQNALHTLIHQRHPTPSCGGHAPTAERTLDPARMLTESLTAGPELENGQDPQQTSIRAGTRF